MIKVGTLCWLRRILGRQAIYNGRVVEVIGPFAKRECLPDGHRSWGYLITAEWLRALVPPGTKTIGFSVPAENLLPFSDPDKAFKLDKLLDLPINYKEQV